MNRSGPDDVVFLGLSLSSSWGNGHATTYRALLRGLHALGRRVLFLERDVPWYTANRDLPSPDFCELAFYSSPEDLTARFASRIAAAPTVIVGSYVPDGIDIIDRLLGTATGLRVFYDIDTPITLAALTNDSCAYLTQRQIPLLDLYLSFAGGPALETLAQTYGARRPRAFYCAVDETAYKPIDTLKTWDLGYLALLWQIWLGGVDQEFLAVRASPGRRSYEEVEDRLPDGGHARLWRRSPDSFFSVPLL